MAKPYVWWNVEDLMPMLEMIVREGATNLRLEYHEGEDESLVLVEKDTGEMCGSYDLSHVCPPDCP